MVTFKNNVPIWLSILKLCKLAWGKKNQILVALVPSVEQ